MTRYSWKHGVPRLALVTGAASGLGQRFCQQLLAEGVTVLGLDLSFDDDARRRLENHVQPGNAVYFLTADIVDNPAIQSVIADAIQKHGAPDLLIHAAGISEPSVFLETSQADFARSIDVNLHGTRNVVAATLPEMRSGAHLVLVASLAGITANYAYAGYSASKFGVVGLTEVLRMEMIERGIDVTSLCPAEIVTPMVRAEWERPDPIRVKLKAFAGSMQVEPACDLIMAGIARRKARIVPGFRAKFTAFMAQVFPTIARAVARQMIHTELRKRS